MADSVINFGSSQWVWDGTHPSTTTTTTTVTFSTAPVAGHLLVMALTGDTVSYFKNGGTISGWYLEYQTFYSITPLSEINWLGEVALLTRTADGTETSSYFLTVPVTNYFQTFFGNSYPENFSVAIWEVAPPYGSVSPPYFNSSHTSSQGTTTGGTLSGGGIVPICSTPPAANANTFSLWMSSVWRDGGTNTWSQYISGSSGVWVKDVLYTSPGSGAAHYPLTTTPSQVITGYYIEPTTGTLHQPILISASAGLTTACTPPSAPTAVSCGLPGAGVALPNAYGSYFTLGHNTPPFKPDLKIGQPGTDVSFYGTPNVDNKTFGDVPFTQITMVGYDIPTNHTRIVGDYTTNQLNSPAGGIRSYGYAAEDAEARLQSFTDLTLTPSILQPPAVATLYPATNLYPAINLFPSS